MFASASLVATPRHCDRAPQDPHLSLPRGGRADFRGRDGQYYCFLSAPRLAINIKTEDATFRLYNLHDKGGTLVVEGSFITEARAAMWRSPPTRSTVRRAPRSSMTSILPPLAGAGALCGTRRWAEEQALPRLLLGERVQARDECLRASYDTRPSNATVTVP